MNPEMLQMLFAVADKSKSAYGDMARSAIGAAKAVGDAAKNTLDFAGQIAGHAADIAATLTAAGAAVAAFATQSYASFDSMTRGLATVSQNAEDLKSQLADLKEIAKLPGLGMQEAVKGSLALQNVGLSARDAERALMGFGNAIAAAGGGKEQLGSVIKGLSDMVAVGKVTMDNVRQISQAAPQFRNFMQQAFGTSDGQELTRRGISIQAFVEGVIEQAEKLPKVTGGISNAFENFSDSLKDALIPLGQGIGQIFEAAGPAVDSFFATIKRYATDMGEVLAATANSGVIADMFSKIGEGFQHLFGANFEQTFRDGFIRVAAGAASIFATIPDAIATAKDYLGQLIPVLAKDAGMIFSYMGQVWEVAKHNAAELFNYIGERTRTLVTVLGDVAKIAAPIVGGILGQQVEQFKMVGELLLRLMDNHPMLDAAPAPNFRGMPAFPHLDALPALPGGEHFNLLRNADQYQQMINASMKPLDQFPDGLAFGGNPGMVAQTEQTSLLEKISRNTGKSADALDMMSLRRQVYGGAERAALGVTPAELAGGRVPGGHYSPSLGYVSGNAAAVASDLERAVMRMVETRLASFGNGVGAFRPGRG